jgi:D-alanyl-D-alanine carboxypeptidase (penicillin-binding protein 5/6)
MRVQAVILSLVVLISLLISGTHFSSTENAEPVAPMETQEPETPNPATIFIKDLYSALSDKAVLAGRSLAKAGQTLSQNLKQNLTFVGRNLTYTANNLNQNFAALQQIFSTNVDNFFTRMAGSDSENSSFGVYPALVSKAEINTEQTFLCDPSKSNFVSKAILIKYLDYSSNVFEFNPEKRWPIASLSKLMTAVVASERMDLDKKITITEKALSAEGTAGDFKLGEVFKVSDLIKAMLVVSSNDAAIAIAEDFGEKEFINEMQKKASELKMFQTTYLEPSGLSFVNQSTVNDLAKLATYIYFNHPELLQISRQRETEILELNSNTQKKLLSINKFAGEPDFIGGKTGYIDEAGRNLIALFEINGKTVLTITLGADDSFAETERLKDFVQNCKEENK